MKQPGKIISNARQLRLNYQAREGRDFTVSEIAERAGVDRNALRRLEKGVTQRYDDELLAKLCAFYGVQPGDILTYVEAAASDDDRRWRGLVLPVP